MACGFMRCGVLHQGAHAAVRPTCWVVEHGNGARAGRGTAGDRCTRHLPCDVSTHMAAGVATSPAAVGPRITRGAAREAQCKIISVQKGGVWLHCVTRSMDLNVCTSLPRVNFSHVD